MVKSSQISESLQSLWNIKLNISGISYIFKELLKYISFTNTTSQF